MFLKYWHASQLNDLCRQLQGKIITCQKGNSHTLDGHSSVTVLNFAEQCNTNHRVNPHVYIFGGPTLETTLPWPYVYPSRGTTFGQINRFLEFRKHCQLSWPSTCL